LCFSRDRDYAVLHGDWCPLIQVHEWRRAAFLVLHSWTTEGWIPLCRSCYPGLSYSLWDQQSLQEVRMSFIKRSLAKASKIGPAVGCADTALAKTHPALFEFLTVTKHDDGSERKVSTVTLCFDQGQFKAFLNDRDSGQSLCVVAPTLNALWIALEASLTSEEPHWRPIPQSGGSSRPGASKKKT